MANMERAFVMIKPEGVKRRLVGNILNRIEKKGFYIAALKFIRPTREILAQHYSEHVGKAFYESLVKNMTSGEVVVMAIEGKDVNKKFRNFVGATDPSKADNGTIRGDYGLDIERNIIHASDSVASAEKEINLWLKEVPEILHFDKEWVY